MLGLGACDSFTESTWSEVYMNNEMGENDKTEVGVQTSETGVKFEERQEEEDSDKEFEQVARDVSECLKVMNASHDGTKHLLE